MEPMDCSLKDLYKKFAQMNTKIPESILSKLAYSVLKAISHLYENNLMHRDIKPENILLNSNADIRVCDFGEVGFMNQKKRCQNQDKGTIRYKAVNYIYMKEIFYKLL